MFQASDQKRHMVVLSPSLGEIMGTWPHLMAREAGEWRAPLQGGPAGLPPWEMGRMDCDGQPAVSIT